MKRFQVFLLGAALVISGLSISVAYANECKVRTDNTYVDGCSGPWLPNVHVAGLNIDLKKIFKSACDYHDRCYNSHGCPKEYCDNEFKHRMDKACDGNYSYDPVTIMGKNVGDKNAVQRTACYTAAESFYQAVHVGGQSSYDADQK